jgi:hypothetical protein
MCGIRFTRGAPSTALCCAACQAKGGMTRDYHFRSTLEPQGATNHLLGDDDVAVGLQIDRHEVTEETGSGNGLYQNSTALLIGVSRA